MTYHNHSWAWQHHLSLCNDGTEEKNRNTENVPVEAEDQRICMVLGCKPLQHYRGQPKAYLENITLYKITLATDNGEGRLHIWYVLCFQKHLALKQDFQYS